MLAAVKGGAVRNMSSLFCCYEGVLFDSRESSIVQVQSQVLVKRSKLGGIKIITSDKTK